MRAALARQDAILRNTVAENRGWVFRTAGDAFCAAFPTAPQAVQAAAQAQLSLHSQDWETGEPLRVRMVLHTCTVEAQSGDYVGAGLNRIGRLLQACHGGQILLTQAVEQLCRDALPMGTSLYSLGSQRLRDLAVPEQVFQLNLEGLPTTFPPLEGLERIPNNLPLQLTSFIGREIELASVQARMAEYRLVTLAGPGGIGKTRLALQAALASLEQLPDGAFLVELAPIADPALVPQATATALRVREQSHQPILETLIHAISAKTLLVILDNCEHLVEACALFAETLLQSCPQLTLLATSREPLGIGGEAVYRVPPLGLQLGDEPLGEIGPGSSEAARLFGERARVVRPDFQITPSNAAAVEQICRRLDGIPLALELAAARVRIFTPEQIAARLDDRFRLLTGGSRTSVARQKTLEALIDWSYDLLSDAERTLFCRLSVFRKGWNYAAAEAVCGPDILDLLDSLVNKSMVLVTDRSAEELRFDFSETIHEYARERLIHSGEASALRDRHLAYFREYTRQVYSHLVGTEQGYWIRALYQEHENLLSALEWSADRDPVAALEMAADMAMPWRTWGYLTQGKRWFERLIPAVKLVEHSAEDPIRVEHALGQGYGGLGICLLALGDYYVGETQLSACVTLHRKNGFRAEMILPLSLLSVTLGMLGRLDEARSYGMESLGEARMAGDVLAIGMSLASLGQVSIFRFQDFESGRELLEESIRLLHQAGDEWWSSFSQYGLGMLEMMAGNLAASRALLERSLAGLMKFGDRQFANMSRSALAELARRENAPAQAFRLYRETLEEWRLIGNIGAIARCLECMAFMSLEQAARMPSGNERFWVQQALRLLGKAEGLRNSASARMLDAEQIEYDQAVAQLRKLATPTEFDQSWSEGRQMDLGDLLTGIRAMS